jgi:hypothetical protein
MSTVSMGLYAAAAASVVMYAQGSELGGVLSAVVMLGVVATSWGVNLRGT